MPGPSPPWSSCHGEAMRRARASRAQARVRRARSERLGEVPFSACAVRVCSMRARARGDSAAPSFPHLRLAAKVTPDRVREGRHVSEEAAWLQAAEL